MAIDHALAEASCAGEGVVRFYGWAPPTVSFGRNEPAEGLFDLEAAEREGIAFVRRPTGGRAVFHHDELTYAVVCPLRAFGGIRKAYHKINEGLLEGLRRLGVAVQLADAPARALPPDAGPCFRDPAGGEVTAEGRKLIGSAQTRIGTALLQHGSLLLGGDQQAITRLRVASPEEGEEGGVGSATLDGLVQPRPPLDKLMSSLTDGLAAVLGGTWADGCASEEEMRLADEHVTLYRSGGWTWRR